MADRGLKELYIEELKDIYNAENQLVKALPKMAKASSSEELKNSFLEHLEQTKGHVQRLEKVFKALGENAKGKKCTGMESLIEEGSEAMQEDFEGAVMDAALIGAAQRVEHYKMTAYGTVIAFANALGEAEQAEILEETLNEEKKTDEKLTEIAETINEEAVAGAEDEEEQEEVPPRRRSRSAA